MSFQKIANISGFECVREVVLRPYRKELLLEVAGGNLIEYHRQSSQEPNSLRCKRDTL